MPSKLNKIDQFQKDWDKFDFTDMPDYINKDDLYIQMKIWVRNERQRKYYTKSISSFINNKIKDHKPDDDDDSMVRYAEKREKERAEYDRRRKDAEGI